MARNIKKKPKKDIKVKIKGSFLDVINIIVKNDTKLGDCNKQYYIYIN